MLYSYRIEQAIRAAAVLHEGQYRKGPAPYPYVAHPFAVGLIVSDYTDDEDTVIAAILHDTLEDTDYTGDELEDDFGTGVRTLVEEVTEPPKESNDAEWKETKLRYLEKLKKASPNALIIATADKIHNMRSIVEEYHTNAKRFAEDFKGTLNDRLIIYQKYSNLLNRNFDNPILHEFNHVFAEYKKFIENAEKTTAK